MRHFRSAAGSLVSTLVVLSLVLSACSIDAQQVDVTVMSTAQPNGVADTEAAVGASKADPLADDLESEPDGPVAFAQADDPAGTPLVYSDERGMNVWLDALIVFADDGTPYSMPIDPVTRIDATSPDTHATVEFQWTADDGSEIHANFYTRRDEQDWWVYQIRTRIDSPDFDGDWIRYPGEFFVDRPTGRYMQSPLGVAYQGSLELDTLAVNGLRFEAFGADVRIDPRRDQGPRPARLDWLMPTREQRFEANYALFDLDTIALIVDGQRFVPEGVVDLSYTGVLMEPGDRQELEIRWLDPRVNEPQVVTEAVCSDDCESRDYWSDEDFSVMVYMVTDGVDWWIYRVNAGVRELDWSDRREGLEVARTPLGSVYEGDLVFDIAEFGNVRLELTPCDGPRSGMREYESVCDQ